jgi:FKBP-type peptidyl-prolyl cis-trans isomerase SlyD
MLVEDDVWVTVRYRLFDAQGDEVEPGERELTYMQGGYGAVFEDIERALAGHEIGYTTSVRLEPEDSFGDYEPQLVRLVPRTQLPAELEVGMTFEGVPGDLDEEEGLYIVTDFTDEVAVLDGNHPLAGMALRFDLEVVDVRAATDEEVAAERANAAAAEGDEDGEQDGELGFGGDGDPDEDDDAAGGANEGSTAPHRGRLH